MSILVTGGAGYIGSHTCVELLKAGYDIILLDNFINAYSNVVKRIEQITDKKVKFVTCDLLDVDGLCNVFKNFAVDVVIHFAALKSPSQSVLNPIEYYNNNIVGTINLCRVMNENNCKQIIFSSSATVYGNENSVPNHENQYISKATNPYGTTKIMIENIIDDICHSDSDWKAISLRYFNPIGADFSGLIGDNPKNEPQNIMPCIIRVAKGQIDKLKITGNDFQTHDGTGIRDYIHVVDLAIGHIKALEYIKNVVGHEIFNLGRGHGYSVLELVKTFEKVNNVKIPYEFVERRPGDVAISFADVSKATKILVWKAEKNLEDMCKDAWNFEMNNSFLGRE